MCVNHGSLLVNFGATSTLLRPRSMEDITGTVVNHRMSIGNNADQHMYL